MKKEEWIEHARHKWGEVKAGTSDSGTVFGKNDQGG